MWAQCAHHVELQLRKAYVALQAARRKFAQVAPTNVDDAVLDAFIAARDDSS